MVQDIGSGVKEMKIDWKHLATTTGYKSLKAAYIHDVEEAVKQKRPLREKEEFLRLFRWVIGRAKHYSYRTGISIESILNEWEEDRGYWWLNFYQPGKQPKLHSKSIKPMGINGIRAYYKKNSLGCDDSQAVKNRVSSFIQHEQREASTKKKGRWSSDRKNR